MTAASKHPRRAPFGSFLLLLAVAAILYGNAVGNSFTLDDHSYLEHNALIRSAQGIGYLLLHPVQPGETLRGHLYRPFAGLIEYLVGSLAGFTPVPFHIANIVLHALNAILLLCLLQRWLDWRLAWITAAVLLCHPVQTEVVASAVGITELLGFLLGTASLFFALVRQPRWWHDLAAGSFFLLALLSKETAVSYLAVAVMAGLLLQLDRRRWRRLAVSYLAPSLVYAALRAHVIGSLLRAPEVNFALLDNPLAGLGALERSANALLILLRYLWLLVWPARLCADYSIRSIELVPTLSPLVLAAVAVHLLLLTAAWLLRRRLPQLSAAVLLFYLGIMPASNLLFAGGTIMGERFLYLPVVGLGLVVATGWHRLGVLRHSALRHSGRWRTALLLVLLLAMGTRTVLRNRDWADDHRLLSSVVAAYPMNAKAHYNLGVLALDRQQLDRSLDHARQAVAIYPEYLDARLLLARLQRQLGHPGQAEQLLRDSLELGVEHEDIYVELGNLYIDSGRLAAAVALLERGAAGNPLSMKIPYNLAMIAMEQGRYEDAEQQLQAALANGDTPDAHFALGSLALMQNRLTMARRELRAARRSPQLRERAITLEAYCLVLDGELAEARRLLSLGQGSPNGLDLDRQLLLAAIAAGTGETRSARQLLVPVLARTGGDCDRLSFPALCRQLSEQVAHHPTLPDDR